MMPQVIADVGNSRIKWGRCDRGSVTAAASLPPDDPDAWQAQLDRWRLGSEPQGWAISGVHPERRDRLAGWLRQRGDTVWILERAEQLPLQVLVSHPDRVGIDRLLNAVAARGQVQQPVDVLIIDAGSAVTVDWVDSAGAFRGGAIFPGLRLMAQSLHDYTALLPRVEVNESNPALPGTSTTEAIAAGVLWAVAGGISALVCQLSARACRASDQPSRAVSEGLGRSRSRQTSETGAEVARLRLPPGSSTAQGCEYRASDPIVFLTGGDAFLLAPVLDGRFTPWPEMTLEGIRLAAEAQP